MPSTASRTHTSEEAVKSLAADAPKNLTIHFDGKKTTEIKSTGAKISQENLAVHVSYTPGYEEGRLLGIPKMGDGKGNTIKDAVVKAVTDHQLQDNVVALCFDTTAANTGKRKGAAVLIEEELNCKCAYFGCRHHVSELICGGIYQTTLYVSYFA